MRKLLAISAMLMIVIITFAACFSNQHNKSADEDDDRSDKNILSSFFDNEADEKDKFKDDDDNKKNEDDKVNKTNSKDKTDQDEIELGDADAIDKSKLNEDLENKKLISQGYDYDLLPIPGGSLIKQGITGSDAELYGVNGISIYKYDDLAAFYNELLEDAEDKSLKLYYEEYEIIGTIDGVGLKIIIKEHSLDEFKSRFELVMYFE